MSLSGLEALHRAPCGILVAQPGMEPVPPAGEAQSLNHWTARQFQRRELSLEAKLDGQAYSVRSRI